MTAPRKALRTLLAAALTLVMGTALAGENDELFNQALGALQTPAEEALATGVYSLRLGDSAYMPAVAPAITPYDELAARVMPAVNGTFESDDPAVVAVDATGLMQGLAEGTAAVTYRAADGDVTCAVTVSGDAMPELAKAMVYVARREFYIVRRAKLPKYNKYAKWYYGKKKEVGWCSVFTIWCANASGNQPIQEEAAQTVAPQSVVYFREGQVGNQYDGFFSLGRFTGIPRPGYPVIYADLSNGYRTTHIGIVVDAVDQGGGLYRVTTVEGNMSNTVKSYCYLYDSNADNHTVGVEKGRRLQSNMIVLPESDQTDPLLQYKLHTDHWAVFGFGASWE